MESTSVYSVAKGIVGATWLISTACFFPPLQSAELASFGRSLFGVLAAVHAVECVAFLGVLRKSSRPLPGELWQTFLYGIVHISVVRNEIRAQEEGQG
jgi:uncharacterized protein YhhL (DUF1145 family)